ncbi:MULTISPECIES: CoA transferase [unclassified Actinopolyspora]|uniref:CaiB/BaiF CoA transferase family protein n=1 Tax=unclassified Actinopolyspora TaxID=2639451 RepID=UPI0013F5EBB5|nr:MULTISPECIES: CoA transferase [unclassified Actinopolyspora]NHD19524.1 CoA transferase [Actinopolyspora sp. BKK2]NHE78680.1 CoA transferase [Actinopolyspora sp. BKK1]
MSDAQQSSPWLEHDGALRGLRVLDLSRILSGPFATMTLADLGADVIKVENEHTGDDTRSWGPPYLGDTASYFLSVNRNKRGLAVDLKSEEGNAVVQRLARSADVIVENFRPGTAARLGLGYEQVAADNPGIVYASISGYGQTGPYSQEPGYDAIAQAVSGMMSVTGQQHGPPARVGVSSADLAAGMWATIGILAALRERERTGAGQWVDVSLLDGQISWLTYVAGGYFATGTVPDRHGSAHPTIVPYQAFPTAEGEIMVAAGNDGLWRAFAEAIGLGELGTDPRFATNPDRVRNRETLVTLVEDALARRSAREWATILAEAAVPAGPINTVEQALDHPQVAARGMISTTEHPSAGTVRTLSSPIALSSSPTSVRSAPPQHGQHNAEILAGLGLDAERLSAAARNEVQ